jgi:flagellar motor switch protein FliN
MSSVNGNDIDTLLAQVQANADAVQADGAVAPAEAAAALGDAAASMAEIAGDMEPPVARVEPGAAAGHAAMTAGTPAGGGSDVGRLLAIEVPVIVRLGMRRLTIGEVMRLAAGAIIEFGKSAEEELDLLANNKQIGKGHAVKVGENFGIKVTTIGSMRETIKKLGS